jgi:hypothetical protein
VVGKDIRLLTSSFLAFRDFAACRQ